MQGNNASQSRPPVLVRAWGDEPVKLLLHRIENNRCYVGNERTTRPIGLPPEQVFAYDEDIFLHMRAQFDTGNTSKLGEEWAKLGVDDFACNKYKISIANC
jgi:hypothetical protein